MARRRGDRVQTGALTPFCRSPTIRHWHAVNARSSSTPSRPWPSRRSRPTNSSMKRRLLVGGGHPVTVHAKMLRLELYKVKADLESELET